jgi:predicted RNA-binding protein
MEDALIVVKKEDVIKVKDLVPALEKAGLDKYV